MNAYEQRFRVWDGKVIHDIDTLSFVQGGVMWSGPGVGSGWCQINKNYWNDTDNPYPKLDQLMRNTGIFDANDKEIWEDDIVKVTYKPLLGQSGYYYGTIYQDDGLWMIDFQNDGTCLCISGPEFEDGIESVKVICNMWENEVLFDTEKMELLIK